MMNQGKYVKIKIFKRFKENKKEGNFISRLKNHRKRNSGLNGHLDFFSSKESKMVVVAILSSSI